MIAIPNMLFSREEAKLANRCVVRVCLGPSRGDARAQARGSERSA